MPLHVILARGSSQSLRPSVTARSTCFQFKVIDGRLGLKPIGALALNMSLSVGSEDCLYLDIYVPASCTSEKPCAVMQWIYGGGWMMGAPHAAPPRAAPPVRIQPP